MKCVGNSVCFALAAASAAIPADAQEQKENSRPNILYIMSDDHCAQTIGVYATVLKDYISTPHLDRIGREGAILNNCFATNSISTPSRGAVLTGQYSHHNGVYILDQALPSGSENFARRLRDSGYQTAIVGKWHLKSEPEGFDYYSILPGQGQYDNPAFITRRSGDAAAVTAKESGYCTDLIGDKCISWMDQALHQKDAPFLMMCHFKACHTPFTPAARHADLGENVIFPEPDNLYDDYEGRSVMAAVHAKIPASRNASERDDRRERIRKGYQEYIRRYIRCAAAIDENVGRMLDFLEVQGELDNTIIIYTSDQGFFVGEHGLIDKRFMYEESIRMPFLIRYPEEIHAGTVSDDMVLNIDFAPTLMDYAGLETAATMDGYSFRNALRNKEYHSRDAFYYRYWMDVRGYDIPAHYGIRTKEYKLIYFYGHQNLPDFQPVWELYDLKHDPQEMHNVYNDPAYRKIVKRLKRRLTGLQKECGDQPYK